MNKGEPKIFSIPTYEMPDMFEYELWQDIMGCSCGGVYKLTDSSKVLLSYPEKFEHQCNKCGNIISMSHAYPYTYIRAKTKN